MATRRAAAIARSKAGPAFGRSAGARLAVIPRSGNSNPELLTPSAPVPRFSNRGVGEADDHEAREPAGDVDLDVDRLRLDPDQGNVRYGIPRPRAAPDGAQPSRPASSRANRSHAGLAACAPVDAPVFRVSTSAAPRLYEEGPVSVTVGSSSSSSRARGVEQRSCLYGLLGGRIRRNWIVRSRAQVQKGGQAARRRAAPRGANFSPRESMCQIGGRAGGRCRSARPAPRCFPSRRLLR